MIGVFDSGVGGLGILVEIRRLLPQADLVYVADQAAAPYGQRSLDEVADRSRRMVVWLKEQGCQVITIACNTASAAALHRLRDDFADLTFVGMEPALKPASTATKTGRVGVVATAATFQGELFASVVDRFGRGVEVRTAACPTWVDLVEAGVTDHRAEDAVRACLRPLVEAGIDVLVLACTHYPALEDVIRAVLGPDVTLIDPGPAVARQTARMARETGNDDGRGRIWLHSTGDAEALASAAQRLGIEAEPAVLAWR